MRKGKKQRADIMAQIKRRFADSAGGPMSVTIERSITTYQKDGRNSHHRQRNGEQAVGVEIISSYAMKMDIGKEGSCPKHDKEDEGTIELDHTDDESTDDVSSYRRARYQEPSEDCRGCHCCCCPCKKKLLQMDEYKILLCGVTTGIQALVERARKSEEQSAESEKQSKSPSSRRARCTASMHDGAIFWRKKAAHCHRLKDLADKEALECCLVAKPAATKLWELDWQTPEDLLQGMKDMGPVPFSNFIRNWCSYMKNHVSGPSKVTPEEYNIIAELNSGCEDIPFNSYKFDRLHQVVSMYNSKWVGLMRAQEFDNFDTIRKRNEMLMAHYRILDKFDFDKGLSDYNAMMRTHRLTHPCSNKARVPDIDCSICQKPLKGSSDVVILIDALRYLHFNCFYEIMKRPVLPRGPPGFLKPKDNIYA